MDQVLRVRPSDVLLIPVPPGWTAEQTIKYCSFAKGQLASAGIECAAVFPAAGISLVQIFRQEPEKE